MYKYLYIYKYMYIHNIYKCLCVKVYTYENKYEYILTNMTMRQPGLFSVVLVPAGPRTPAAAARIALVWRCGGDLVFSWGNTRCVEARERREDSTYEKK